MKIKPALIPLAYNLSKNAYEGKVSRSEAISELSINGQMNKNSAADYIYNFKYLMDGRKFTRTLNTDSMRYFINNMLKDYGKARLSRVLSSLYKHIEYYESKENVTMRSMRKIYNDFSQKMYVPQLVSNVEQIIKNIETVEQYLIEGADEDKLQMLKYIKAGICFIAYKINDEVRFVPSKFIGYKNNSLDKHVPNQTDGRETNIAINEILGSKPMAMDYYESKYIEYCHGLGIDPNLDGSRGIERKYWIYNLENDFRSNEQLTGDFPEGKVVERVHRTRERNSQVILLAKKNFKLKHGKLFCQICEFDFYEKYGKLGDNFIEAHHTVAVSDMPADYKTKPEEIAMLCANCHRMVHKRRPWLGMSDLKKLLK